MIFMYLNAHKLDSYILKAELFVLIINIYNVLSQ